MPPAQKVLQRTVVQGTEGKLLTRSVLRLGHQLLESLVSFLLVRSKGHLLAVDLDVPAFVRLAELRLSGAGHDKIIQREFK